MIKPITITHDQYEKLVDDIYYLGVNTILRMNVVLAKKLEDGTRYSYHSEFMYKSNKYIDTNEVITMRRSFSYYLTIENLRSNINNEKESIMIRVQDMLHIRHKLNLVYMWFTSDEFVDLFAYSKGKLIMLNKVEPILITGFPQDKKIMIEPTIIQYENEQFEGIRLYLNSESNYTDMTVDRLSGLLYLINTINLYQSAQLLLNYHGRPEMGNNIIIFGDDHIEDMSKTETKINRQIVGKVKKKSFFDKIDEI